MTPKGVGFTLNPAEEGIHNSIARRALGGSADLDTLAVIPDVAEVARDPELAHPAHHRSTSEIDLL